MWRRAGSCEHASWCLFSSGAQRSTSCSRRAAKLAARGSEPLVARSMRSPTKPSLALGAARALRQAEPLGQEPRRQRGFSSRSKPRQQASHTAAGRRARARRHRAASPPRRSMSHAPTLPLRRIQTRSSTPAARPPSRTSGKVRPPTQTSWSCDAAQPSDTPLALRLVAFRRKEARERLLQLASILDDVPLSVVARERRRK